MKIEQLIMKHAMKYFNLPSRVELRANETIESGGLGQCVARDKKIIVTALAGYGATMFCEILCHEIVHAKQILSGRLERHYCENMTMLYIVFEGNTYDLNDKKITYDEYLKLPWEAEAREQGPEMAKVFMQYLAEQGVVDVKA